ncbi:MAG TPA: 5-oxoprolinase subunit PxpB [Opitutaceae bacterium]
MLISPLGDSALLIEIEAESAEAAATTAQRLARRLANTLLPGVHDVVPAFGTVSVHYAPGAVQGDGPAGTVEAWVREQASRPLPKAGAGTREVTIPVCYGGNAGPDLAEVAAHAGLSTEEAIALHSEARYVVRAVGFTPGFPYLAGLPAKLHTPRRATPRTRVPAGSVGIGGAQTGIYPLATPGGWHLIGRTPLALFDPASTPPSRLQVGDVVRFRSVPEDAWAASPVESRPPSANKSSEPLLPRRAGALGPTGDDKLAWMEVVKPGIWTTVQDVGRRGWQAQGVPVAGAMDCWALRVGNLLVGNAPEAAAVECTLRGPEVRFSRDAVVAVTGAAVEGIPVWQPFLVRAGETLSLAKFAAGCRAYLAVAGGVAVPSVLGSRSTYVPAGLGGLEGGALRAGDRLPLGQPRVQAVAGGWRLSPAIVPAWSAEPVVRVVRGAQADWFKAGAWAALLGSRYRVASQSDRMGLRLRGHALDRSEPREMVSEGVGAGAIQVPPDGQPIVLMADCQTLGGYPKIAHAISVDLPVLAQARPGDSVRFAETTLEEAQRMLRERERDLGILRVGLYQRYGVG